MNNQQNHATQLIIYTCSICNQEITTKQYSFLCHQHFEPNHWVHKKCTSTLIKDYHPAWTCPLHTSVITTPATPNSAITPSSHKSNATHQSKSQISPPSISASHPNPPTKKKNHNLKILKLNINGIKNKTAELRQLLIEENIDVAVIQETRLHHSSKTPSIPNYSFTRQDAQSKQQPNPKPVVVALLLTSKKIFPTPIQHRMHYQTSNPKPPQYH